MAYWLFKSEPHTWSWNQQMAKGAEGEGWDGVRNHQASNNMKAMKIGDRGFFYHSGKDREIVGIVEVIEEYHPDPTDESGRFGMVTLKAICPLPAPVPLKDVKANPDFAELALVRHTRLSVMPVAPEHWKKLCAMGGVDKKTAG